MHEIAIRVEGLSKQYRIGERESYKALRDVITDAAASPFRRLSALRAKRNGQGGAESNNGYSPLALSPPPSPSATIWALDDVSFEVKRGEVVGIIGRNGAGKSTLLKILSRITKPTKGRAEIQGRVGSLLEVGTGFHPELTGRENIYLNAAILGMRRAEVAKKFDEIVAFAEVEKFIDTPVKRYSSGMYVRLAFAVAAHMETEILLVDEVLAVGDVAFQKKCLGKMGDVARLGRTVLFVSHNLSAIASLCKLGLLLHDGRVSYMGHVAEAVRKYLSRPGQTLNQVIFADSPKQPIQFLNVQVTQANMPLEADFGHDLPILITLGVRLSEVPEDLEVSIRIINDLGIPLFTVNRSDSCSEAVASGRVVFEVEIPAALLPSGRYFITCGLHAQARAVFDLREECISFNVHDTGTSLARYESSATGVVLMHANWKQRTERAATESYN